MVWHQTWLYMRHVRRNLEQKATSHLKNKIVTELKLLSSSQVKFFQNHSIYLKNLLKIN